jgi:hypothetical protein
MPFVQCCSCEAVFHAEPSRYYWCDCGESLTDGDEIRHPAPPADPHQRTGRFRPAPRTIPVGESS